MNQQPYNPFDPRFAQPYPLRQYPSYPQQPSYPSQSYIPSEPSHHPTVDQHYQAWKVPTLHAIKPWVQYGLKEAQHTSVPHAMTEVAAIAYLLGKGIEPHTAHMIVESWEKGEAF